MSNLNKLVVSNIVLFILIIIIISRFKCSSEKKYTQAEYDRALQLKLIDSNSFSDTLNFVRGQLSLQYNKSEYLEDSIDRLNFKVDNLIYRHKKTIATPIDTMNIVTVPPEFVNECDTCFNLLETYKTEATQYRFERDGYDSLMRIQNDLNGKQIQKLSEDKNRLRSVIADISNQYEQEKKKLIDSIITRKLKISAATISINNNYLPNGAGGGVIYEDKKNNEFGLNAFGSKYGTIFTFNFAKTLSFRKRK